MDWSLQARSTATSPEFWSGWVLQLVHLASAENRPDVVKANVRCLHSTMKSRGALQDEPLDLTISCLNSNSLSVSSNYRSRATTSVRAGSCLSNKAPLGSGLFRLGSRGNRRSILVMTSSKANLRLVVSWPTTAEN